LALNQDFPLVRRFQADELPEQHRLAAATRSHEDEDFTGVDLKINALEHFMSIVTLAKPSDLKPDAPPFSQASHIVPQRGFVSGRFHFAPTADKARRVVKIGNVSGAEQPPAMPPAFRQQLPRQ
jgi:hypothetical protein